MKARLVAVLAIRPLFCPILGLSAVTISAQNTIGLRTRYIVTPLSLRLTSACAACITAAGPF